jgi:lipoprotein-anchoring transpeptidase ErfK/SrfK
LGFDRVCRRRARGPDPTVLSGSIDKAAPIGSEEKPAPSGDFKIKGISWNPKYEYDPKFAWKGVNTKRKLSIGPGPNNPVGLVWIDVTDPTYGIHGTPGPSDIGKTRPTAASA